jgi:hypothetical protein
MNQYSNDSTDDELYDDETDTEDNTDDNLIYEPDEYTITKYNIVICEKYSRKRHGITNDEIQHHYLTYIRFKTFDLNLINHIISNRIFQLEIAECIYTRDMYCVSILKTFWIKLIQRRWKKIYKERKLCILKRSNLNALKFREIYGRWPNNCLCYPMLKGMLSDLFMSLLCTPR